MWKSSCATCLASRAVFCLPGRNTRCRRRKCSSFLTGLRSAAVAYLTGRREFYGHEFLVSADTLIPRADTETLVDAVLARLPEAQPLRIADLGTGTGAIAISLALARPHWQVEAVDFSVAILD